MMRSRFLLFRQDSPPGPTPTPPNTETRTETRVERVIVDADVEKLKLKYGSIERAVRVLFRDAHRAREGRRVAEDRVKVLEDKLGPDSLVLTAAEKADWLAYQKLGKKPAELETIVTDFGKLEGEVTESKRDKAARSAAKVLQWNEDATVRVAAKEKLDIVLLTEKVDDKDVEVPYVQPKEQGATRVKLADFVKDKTKFDPIYLPALQAKGGTNGNGSEHASGEATDGARGIPWIDQSSSTSEPTSDQTKTAGPSFLRDKRVLPSQRKSGNT
jgi:hypothetical protein